jgi:hypothetical protein
MGRDAFIPLSLNGGLVEPCGQHVAQRLERTAGEPFDTAFATIPPRVDYELTQQGRSLHQPLLTLASWARSQQGYIETSRQKFDDRPE